MSRKARRGSMENFKKYKPYIFEALFYLAVFVFSLISYVLIKPHYEGLGGLARGEVAKTYALCLLVVLALVAFLLYKNKKLNRKTVIFLLIIASFLLKLCYMLYTEGVARQHDTDGHTAHFGYAEWIYSNGTLPNTNDYQFYHPPLNAFIQSRFMVFFEVLFTFINNNALWLVGGKPFALNAESYFYACQTLAVLYSVIISVTSCKILKRLQIDGVGGIIAICFILFFPRFVQLSGQLNNDLLGIMLTIVSVYWSIRFFQDQSWLNICFLAGFLGLALMTKLNTATICLPVAILFLFVFIDRIKTKNTEKIVDICTKYFTFILICAPLGLWFQVYANVRFGQPFAYVFPYLNGELSTASIPWYRRFLIPSFTSVVSTPFANAWEDYNIIDYMIKSSMFGEFNYWNGTAFAFVAVVLQYLYHIAFVVTTVFWVLHHKFEKTKLFDLKTILLGSIHLTLLVSQVAFYIKMPFGCTMDFRYVVPLVLSSGGLLGAMYNDSKNTRLVGFKTLASVTCFFAMSMVLATSIFYFVCI